MNLKTCLALIGTLIASFILMNSGNSNADVHAAGFIAGSGYASAATPERDAKQIARIDSAYRSDCFAPRLTGLQLVSSTNGPTTGHRLVGGSSARQIACARG